MVRLAHKVARAVARRDFFMRDDGGVDRVLKEGKIVRGDVGGENALGDDVVACAREPGEARGFDDAVSEADVSHWV
jgi:hypothetical protein